MHLRIFFKEHILADTSHDHSDEEHQPVTLEHPLRSPAVLVSLVATAVIALAAGFLVEHGAAKESAEAPVADPGSSTAVKDLAQARTVRQLEAINLNLLSTQSDLKKLAEELSALTARVDALQDATSSIPRQPNGRVQAVTGPSKRPSHTPKPVGSNSVAGAP
jgi:hypothetical protein